MVFVIILILIIIIDSSSTIYLFKHQTSFISSDDQTNIFDKTIRRLLYTHSIAYNDSNICGSSWQLKPEEKKLLKNISKLMPQLRNELVPYPDGYFKGQGIVLTVGINQLLHTKLNLRIIEWLKIKLSIEVWYSSTQISDHIANELLNYVPKLNLKMCCFERFQCHSLNNKEISLKSNYVYLPQTKSIYEKIYSYKLAAILSSTFDEIIFLDSDCYMVRDPTDLFQKDPMYQIFGSLFYPDIYKSHQHPQLWSILNTTCVNNEFSLDSGVLLLDKKRVWNGLYMAKLMGDHQHIFYQYFISHGDKDTFRLSFRYMKIPYYIVGIPCSTGYLINRSFCGVTLCKTDSLGLNVYFEHIHHPKHLPELTFFKKNFTHTMIALADPNNQNFYFGYCALYPLPCFQVGFKDEQSFITTETYCKTSALPPIQKPFIQISSAQSVLWNPNLETKLLLIKKSSETMPGFIDFYFQTQNQSIFKNAKL